MSTFISTLRFTEKGLSTIQESPKRAAAFKATAKKLGCKITGEYWTLGTFDGVIIFDSPDDETATALMLHLASQGNVHTSTVRAFGASEMGKVEALLAKR
jgi:uncharacterized protein with GYD domain